MIFSLDVRPAGKGDCLLLHYGNQDDPALALVDGGASGVYRHYLKPRLIAIREARGLPPEESLPVDLMMVTHIDDDHIRGILDLTKDLIEAKTSAEPLPLKIGGLWHNSFDDIIGNTPDELLAAVTASFGPASLGGEPDTEGLESEAAKVLASVGQGMRLRDDARMLQIPINDQFAAKLVRADTEAPPVDLGNGLAITVAGPMKTELLALQDEHDKFLEKTASQRSTTSALASFTDTSVANLSSLVLYAQVGDRTMLLTGDARGDKILEGLELVGLVEAGGTLHVDLLKVPHHGSDRNIDPIFFRRITANHYVLSGDGEHGNPERHTLQMLLDECGDNDFTIHLTYPLATIDQGREDDWNKEQLKEKNRAEADPTVTVREDWSADEHALVSFFAAHDEFAKKVSVVDEHQPHVIDILEEVGY